MEMCTETQSKKNNTFKLLIYTTCLTSIIYSSSFFFTGHISSILRITSVVLFTYLSVLFIIYNYSNAGYFSRKLILYVGTIPILYLCSIIISHLIVINSESARSVISSIIQSDAAVLAIYITLSLVAVQQASSSYSPRVMKIFNDKDKNPDFWILVTIYISSIIYESLILGQIDGSNLVIIEDNNLIIELLRLQNHVIFTYFLGSYTFIILLPNIKTTINFLDPFYIIDLLSSEITEKEIMNFISKKKTNSGDKEIRNPLLPILDIIRASVSSQDNETSLKGIESIEKKVIDIIENQTDQEESLIVSKHFIENMLIVLQLALDKNSEQSVSQVIISIGNLAKTSQKRDMEEIRIYSLNSLKKMVPGILESKMNQAISNMALVFLEIGELSNGLEDGTKDECVCTIKLIINYSIDHSLFYAVMNISTLLKNSVLQNNVGLDFKEIRGGYRIGNKKYTA